MSALAQQAAPAAASAGPADRARRDAAVGALRFSGVRKSFGSVQALKGIDLSVLPGEVHAVVGENGAGKSTLISIAAGVLGADAGAILRDGEAVAHPTPWLMRARGVAVAFQHPALAPDLTAFENIRLANPRLAGQAGLRQARALLDRIATDRLRVDPRRRVEQLSLAQRHVVEIARALASDPCVLILDEPTEPFQEPEVRKLFALVRELRDSGVAVVYISHRLHEVLQIADTISVLRDGELIETRARDAFPPREIVELIAGQPIASMFPSKLADTASPADTAPVLEVADLSGPGFRDVSLSVRRGEILGIAGVEGQGQREFLRALAGLNRPGTGEARIGGAPCRLDGPAAARGGGIGFVPDDRHAEGLFLPLSVRENLAQALFGDIARFGFLPRSAEIAATRGVAQAMRVKARSLASSVSSLSGGNQQKVLIGREIAARPRVLIVDEPTKGVDVGSKSEIYGLLRDLAASGVAVLVSSSDGVELEGLSDRVLIFARGGVVSELRGAEVTDVAITHANLSATALREGKAEHGRRRRLRALADGDHLPGAAVALVLALIALVTSRVSPDFLSAANLGNLLTSLSVLGFLALGQLCVMLTGAIDLSIGPFAGLVVVLASFLLPDGVGPGGFAAGWAAILGLGAAFGLVQGWLVERLRIPSIVVTLATFIGIQGLSLLLRPQPAGMIDDALGDDTQLALLGVPAAMWAALAAAVLLEAMLLRSGFGRRLRAVGSDALASHRLGVKAPLMRIAAFGLCSLLATLGGLVLAGQVGIGSPRTGIGFTLTSITAVVLGGASVVGGRGSFLCTLAGAALIQVLLNATTFLQVNSAWQYWLTGAATLGAASLFSLARPQRTGP